MGENRKKWVFTTSSQTDFTTTNLKDSTITKSLNKVFTTINSPNRDFTTTNLNKVSTTNNLRDFTTMLDFTMTKKTRTVSTTTSKKTVSTTTKRKVSTTNRKN